VIVVRARGFHDAADRSAFLAELKDRWAGRAVREHTERTEIDFPGDLGGLGG
jgi:hypothetical protein